MELSVVDTSVVIAYLDPNDPQHSATESAMNLSARHHRLTVPVVAYAESLVRAYRTGEAAARVVLQFFDTATSVEPLTPAIARAGAQLRARHSIRLPDALILATGIELEADEILTADRRWRRIDSRVKLVG